MKILVTGSHGLVGSALNSYLTGAGHTVLRLVRELNQAAKGDAIYWDPSDKMIDLTKLEGHDAVVHLAGDNIGEGRWTAQKKARIRDSRVIGTRLLSESLAKLKDKPSVLVSASAVGYYGDRGAETLDESASAGDDFLAQVCLAWEQATEPARAAGIRTVHMRFGVILSPEGGALKKMLLPFKMGAGGVIGSGEQYMSWIALDDVLGAVKHALDTEELEGPVNTVAPNPVTNRAYTKTLGHVLARPTIVPMPAFAARLAFGEMADALLLSSQRATPKQLRASGYEFKHPDLEGALRHLLDREVEEKSATAAA